MNAALIIDDNLRLARDHRSTNGHGVCSVRASNKYHEQQENR
jgi:hypothetical protein